MSARPTRLPLQYLAAVRLISSPPSVEIYEVSVTESLAQASASDAVSHVLTVIDDLQATVVNSAEQLGISVIEQNGEQSVTG